MKKILSIAVIMVLCVAMFVGCAPKAETPAESTPEATEAPAETTAAQETEEAPAQGDGPLLAFICKDLSQEWFVGTSTAMQETAKSLGAKDVLLFDCAMSPDKYMTALDSAISQEVDVLIVCPPDQQLSQITVERCAEAGIKVMADDDGLIDESGKHIAPALELDAYVCGEGQGEWLANYYTENNLGANVAEVGYMLLTMNEVSSCVPRHEGARDKFIAGVTDFPEAQIFPSNYDGTSDKAFNVAAATITANPDVKYWIVTAPNDEGAQGATRALEQAGVDKDACVVGMGGYLAIDEFKKEYSAFKAAAYFDPILDGTIAATAAMKWFTDDVVPYDEYKKDGAEFGIYPFGSVMVDRDDYSIME